MRHRKPKLCRARNCSERFVPTRPLQKVCSPACGIALAQQQREAKERKQKRERKRADNAKREAMKTKPQLTREAQKAFNEFIRLRDEGRPCICCGRTTLDNHLTGSSWDAGHYRSTGAAPHLRFNEDNCHRQLVQCNRHGAGRAVDYRLGLAKRIGIERVEALEADNTPRHWTHDELREIRDTYRTRVNQIKRERREAS